MSRSIPIGISTAADIDEPTTLRLAGQTGLDAISVQYEFRAPDAGAFSGELSSGQIGAVGLETLTTSEADCVRTAQRITEVPYEVLHLITTVSGRVARQQDGRTGEYGPGSLGLMRSDAPSWAGFQPDAEGRTTTTFASIPLTEMGSQAKLVRHLTAAPLRPTPMLDVAEAFLRSLSGAMPSPGTPAAQFIEHALIDMAMALVAEQVDEALNAESVESGSRLRVRDYILRRLPDHDLGPDKIAAALGMSRRYLYKLFESEDTSVAAFVRQTRLEQARIRLADPAWAGSTITEIAAGLGFGGPDQFSRAFKARYILSPSEYRREAALGADGPRGETPAGRGFERPQASLSASEAAAAAVCRCA